MSRVEPNSQPRIYLLSRSALDRLAYRHLMEREFQQQVLVDSDFTPTAVWAAMRLRPELVLVDADVPTVDVLDVIDMVARLSNGGRILLISSAVEPAQIEAWGRCPLQGYVVKEGGVEELRAAIAALLAGQEYYSDGVRAALARGAARLNGTSKLSRREAELLPLLAKGLTLRDAAQQMAVSYKTADSYRTSLLRKLGVRDRVELARYAIRSRIIQP